MIKVGKKPVAPRRSCVPRLGGQASSERSESSGTVCQGDNTSGDFHSNSNFFYSVTNSMSMSMSMCVSGSDCDSVWDAFAPSPSACDSGLIPGLPHDVALQCLARIPRNEFPSCRLVCRSWRNALNETGFHDVRKQSGKLSPCIFLRIFDTQSKKYKWTYFHTETKKWCSVPGVNNNGGQTNGAGLSCVSLHGYLYAFGGMSPEFESPTNSVYRFDPRFDCWESVKSMNFPRAFFAGKVINGRIYAAGGINEKLYEIKSAEFYCPETDEWRYLPEMPSGLARFDSAVLDGCLYATEGWHWPYHFSPCGFLYDPSLGKWQTIKPGLAEGWTGLGTVIKNRLFTLSQSNFAIRTAEETFRLTVYDPEKEDWCILDGPTLPPKMKPPFSIVAIHGRIYIIGQGLTISIAKLAYRSSSSNIPSVDWDTIDSVDPKLETFCPDICEVLLA